MTDVDTRVITNVENYHTKEITTAFTVLTGDVPVGALKEKYAKAYMKEAYKANVNVPDEYYLQYWGVDPANL